MDNVLIQSGADTPDHAAAGLPDERSLDPQDWEALRRLGHRMVDDVLASLQGVRGRPVWTSPPESARAALRQPIPWEAEGAERAYQDFLAHVQPYPTGNIHPRFWGWVMGTGTPFTVLAELLAAGMNCNASGFDDASALVEDQVLAWLKELMGFPATASGLLVSGGSMANLVGLAVARNAQAGFDVRTSGLAGAPRPLVLYASVETHNSVRKAVELMGLGTDSLRLVPVDADYRMDVAVLQSMLAADRAAGRRPLAVVGNAGTVNTGAIDDLAALADLCAREGLWFHVDGAFGALAALSPRLKPRLAGLERADSVAFDLHKWGYFPIEVGCTLVRRGEEHQRAFTVGADYLAVAPGGLASRQTRFAEYGIQLSRNFRALKVWMGLKELGVTRLGAAIEQNVEQARYLAARVQREPELELRAPVPLNVVCFRFVGDRRRAQDLDALNRRLLVALQESGLAAPSYTVLHGCYVLRAAITNHRSRREDFDVLVDTVLRLGREIAGGR